MTSLIEALATKELPFAAQREFERIEIRDRLVNWSQSEDLVELLEDLKDGKRHDGLTGSRISRAA